MAACLRPTATVQTLPRADFLFACSVKHVGHKTASFKFIHQEHTSLLPLSILNPFGIPLSFCTGLH